eukprot:TRINITY_DN9451_c0_g1_i1.p1 TRINITY_DN9451_c0_g1~~TRINITY_DN9451_c0_g1_i1.p1  ORF type:complete len:255 (+),score=21.13 TRINITY_DN9451_c0_g1_i1:76-840(+)
MLTSALLAAKAHQATLHLQDICQSLETTHRLISDPSGTLMPPVCISSHFLAGLFECSSDLFEAVQICADAVVHTTKVAASVVNEIWLPCFVAHNTVRTLRKFDVFDLEDSDEEDQDLRTKGRSSTRSSALYLNIVVDAFMLGSLVKSFGVPIAVHLRTWALGGLVLGFPLSLVVQRVAQKYGFRRAFVLDVFFACVAYWWLVWGTHMLASHPEMSTEVPSLFWASFAVVIAAWTGLTCSVVCVLACTVLAMIVG